MARRPRRDDWIRDETHCTFRKTIEPDSEKNLLAIPRKQRAADAAAHRLTVAKRLNRPEGGFGGNLRGCPTAESLPIRAICA